MKGCKSQVIGGPPLSPEERNRKGLQRTVWSCYFEQILNLLVVIPQSRLLFERSLEAFSQEQ